MTSVLRIAAILLCHAAVYAQTALPVKEWKASSETPFVLYLSGDGGFNSFSTSLCTAISKAGYSITSVNARSYFWNKKTPEQTAQDVLAYLTQQLAGRKNQQVVLAGYSFGADVLPFIVNKLPGSFQKNLISVLLVAPSTSTDFEVHLSDLLGSGAKRSMDVVAETNRMNIPRTTTFFGSDDTGFPVQSVRLRNYHNEVLPGGHHFEGNAENVARTMLKYF